MGGVTCPTAHAMLTLSRTFDEHPVQAYLCTWTAFECIVRLVARQSGVKPHYKLRKNGTLRMMEIGGIKMPKVISPKQELIRSTALGYLDTQVKHALIVHRSVKVFVNRTPTFGNRLVKKDSRGQQLNGVIDVSRTIDARYPIWSPITLSWYRAYMRGEADDVVRQDLVMQIVAVLDTLRVNILYADGTNEKESGQNLAIYAKPLLHILINGLTRDG